jgi:hypothetical protein
MADFEKTEFEFPDEATNNPRKGGAVVEPEEKDDIEIVDDTPEEDRNRTPMAEPPKDVTDDELAKYDEGVQKRIKHFTKGYHEERRAKEAALREKDEAIRIAQAIVEENKKLKGSLNSNQTALIEQAKKNVANDLEEAKRKYKAAYESGDSDAMVAAQEELTDAKMKAQRISSFRPTPLQDQETNVQMRQPEAEVPRPDEKALRWQEKNPWFGSDEEMTSFALGYHTKLIKSGVATNSDDYYEKLNSRLKQVFPDAFESEKTEDAPTPPKKSNVVAPATRSTAPRKVVLTKTQVDLAKRLGVPLELYARKVAEEMRK